MNKILVFCLLVSVLGSCSGSSEKANSETTNPVSEGDAPVLENPSAFHPGMPLYQKHCLACHQADGEGIPKLYPSLVDTKWVNGDVATLIRVVTEGLSGEIEVHDKRFNSVMASLPHLSNREIADVLSYVRKEFGPGASEISEEEVKKVRNPDL